MLVCLVSGHCDQIESKSRSEEDGKDEGVSTSAIRDPNTLLRSRIVILPMDHEGLEREDKLILDNVLDLSCSSKLCRC